MTPETNTQPICCHPDGTRRSWAVIPNLQLDWCGTCGAFQFADHPWEFPRPDLHGMTPEHSEDTHNGVHLSQITSGHVEQLRQVYPPERMRPLERALEQYQTKCGELEKPGQINVDARGAKDPSFHFGQRKVEFFKCGNCGQRIEKTGDQIEDHHAAMRHKQTCRTNTVLGEQRLATAEYDRLVTEHAAQPMQVAARFAEENNIPLIEALRETQHAIGPAEQQRRLQLAAAGDIVTAKTPREWWQFWRWLEW